jgi:hypothetical protein
MPEFFKKEMDEKFVRLHRKRGLQEDSERVDEKLLEEEAFADSQNTIGNLTYL